MSNLDTAKDGKYACSSPLCLSVSCLHLFPNPRAPQIPFPFPLKPRTGPPYNAPIDQLLDPFMLVPPLPLKFLYMCTLTLFLSFESPPHANDMLLPKLLFHHARAVDVFTLSHDCDEATVWTVQKGGCEYFCRTDLFDRERVSVSFHSSVEVQRGCGCR